MGLHTRTLSDNDEGITLVCSHIFAAQLEEAFWATRCGVGSVLFLPFRPCSQNAQPLRDCSNSQTRASSSERSYEYPEKSQINTQEVLSSTVAGVCRFLKLIWQIDKRRKGDAYHNTLEPIFLTSVETPGHFHTIDYHVIIMLDCQGLALNQGLPESMLANICPV